MTTSSRSRRRLPTARPRSLRSPTAMAQGSSAGCSPMTPAMSAMSQPKLRPSLWTKLQQLSRAPTPSSFSLPYGARSRILNNALRGVAQLGSASALGAEGRWFESSRPDHSHPRGPLGPLPGAGSCAAAWAWFRMGEVRVRPSAAAVVQLVEQQPSKLPVAGSSPVRRSIAHEATGFPVAFLLFSPRPPRDAASSSRPPPPTHANGARLFTRRWMGVGPA